MNWLNQTSIDTSQAERDLLKWDESWDTLKDHIHGLLEIQNIAKFTSDIRAILIENSSIWLIECLSISTSYARMMFTLGWKEYSISVLNGFKYNFNGKEVNSWELHKLINTLLFDSYGQILKNNFNILLERESSEENSFGIPSMQGMKASDEFERDF